MSRNLHSQDAFDMRRDLDNPQRYAIGLYRWAELVWPRGDWDFKKEIANTFGRWCLHSESNALFNFDIWVNIHYGYVGSSLGMGQCWKPGEDLVSLSPEQSRRVIGRGGLNVWEMRISWLRLKIPWTGMP